MEHYCSFYDKVKAIAGTIIFSSLRVGDRYFTLDIDRALIDAGFQAPTITANTPRHCTVIATA